MLDVFTPMNSSMTDRLRIPVKNIKVISGNLFARGEVGKKATIELKDGLYDVYTISCGLDNCNCDAQIVPVTEEKFYCGKYSKDEVLPDENGNCSLCGAPISEYGECMYWHNQEAHF